MKSIYSIGSLLLLGLISCDKDKNEFDATGVFEAKEIIVSAETSGQILQLNLEEGTQLTAGQSVGLIDCENLNLQKSQLEASLEALGAKRTSAGPQVEVLKAQLASQEKALSAQEEQLQVLEREQNRVQNLAKSDAVPTKQLDDINGQVAVLTKQIAAAESQLAITRQQMKAQQDQITIANRAVMSESKPMQERIAQVENMMDKCAIENPVNGTVLVKYAEENEVAAPGKALYKLADLSELKLRAYITNDQLATLKLGQAVTVMVDNGEEGYKELPGTVEWISDKAEFTPKTIQTKDERSNLVYAIKVAVKNDGYLKLGMYGEVKF
ncbi:HlyD family secretion protein [Jiulongibacter sediminis]|uniref:Secretion protein n=1 Tax=Jiulongibacter sediminis TaxID=1605367 RepID=A0A0N8H9M5_9BACT|nr:HlyD family efflux transporter periplasmic adaptor subunit [Jiulongibacter sediminis]KPM47788.1 secretion protein [Jiulongibacter sediminis]TBX23972.1 secretion protein [Jiulongibacter sediminis]